MQDKKARKAARAVNLFIDPKLKEDTDYVKKNGNRLTKRKRDFSRIVEMIDKQMRNVDSTLPRDVSPLHFLTLQKLSEIAFRDNTDEKDIKCPSCGEPIKIRFPNVKAEKNSIDCATTLADRMYPKLGHLTQEINLVGQINVVSEYIVGIIVKYVPAEKRSEAMAKISEMFERLTENDHCTSSQNDPITVLESTA